MLDALQGAVCASLAPSYLAGILPIAGRGNDSDTTAAVAGGVLAARGLAPPAYLIAGLCSRHSWFLWSDRWPGAAGALAAFVAPGPLRELPGPERPVPGSQPPQQQPPGQPPQDPEAAGAHREAPDLPRFSWDRLQPGLLAGRAPLFCQDAWELRRQGVTHVLDLREQEEWAAQGRYGESGLLELKRLGIARLHLPVTDLGVPTPTDFATAVSYIDAALRLGGTVYVHCRAGMERTAAILTAWYGYTRGTSAEAALAHLRRQRPALQPLAHQLAAAREWLEGESRA